MYSDLPENTHCQIAALVLEAPKVCETVLSKITLILIFQEEEELSERILVTRKLLEKRSLSRKK